LKDNSPCQLMKIISIILLMRIFFFLNPNKVEDATRQILNLEQYLKRNLPKFNFKIFGSFRNRISLYRDIDGDVCIY